MNILKLNKSRVSNVYLFATKSSRLSPKIRNSAVRISMVLFLVLCCARVVLPQAQMSAGDIKGTVTDATNAILPSATVTVTNTDTGVERQTTTDAMGTYRFLILPPGTY